MPVLWPEQPEFVTASERLVWEQLCADLGADDLLIANERVTDHSKDFEIDIVVVMPGAGVVVVEVKGGGVRHDGTSWRQQLHGNDSSIDPVEQARTAKYALRTYIETDNRWGSRSRVRWGHVVVLPYLSLADDFALPDCPRWAVVGSNDMPELAQRLRAVGERQKTQNRRVTTDDAATIAEILRGRSLPQRDLIGDAAEREDVADRLTQAQTVILDAIRLLPRVEVRGGAGSGKTWLALEQARRLSRDGRRVALLCYSRGLAAFLERRVRAFSHRRDVPAYVGTFHGLGAEWGATAGSDDDTDYWERRLPEQMVTLAADQAVGHRFDAIVVDEAQDFADQWWPALFAALKDADTGGLYAFSDEGQRVFSRYGGVPDVLLPVVLDHNLRNTVQIAESFNTLATMRMRLLGGQGPAVRFVECPTTDALACADDEADALLDAGWRPQDVALLATGSRHPEQAARQAAGPEAYWESFWDDEQVFYGHVLSFKGLERRAVVLAMNEQTVGERSKERLYVGLSRARDQLVVCGDPAFVEQVGGSAVLRRLRGH